MPKMKREEGCPHGGRNPRECDACEVERLRAALERIVALSHDPRPSRMYVLAVAKDALAGKPLRPIRKETP